MKKIRFLFFLIVLNASFFGQTKSTIETSDIDRFWQAFDELEYANTTKDSLEVIQKKYIDQASPYFKEYLRLRTFTAREYVWIISQYPKFWNSIRKETENIKYRTQEIDKVFDVYEQALPSFKRPNVCFAIGGLRSGGTISNGLILIGAEIAASTSQTDSSELTNWLKSIMGKSGDIIGMVSHEAIHTQQKKGKLENLVEFTIQEGSAVFLSELLAGFSPKESSYFKFGEENDCALKNEFLTDFSSHENDLSKWLFNGTQSKNRPADLGYYIGYKIAQDYYNLTNNKNSAIRDLLDRKNYMKIFYKSIYLRKECLDK